MTTSCHHFGEPNPHVPTSRFGGSLSLCWAQHYRLSDNGVMPEPRSLPSKAAIFPAVMVFLPDAGGATGLSGHPQAVAGESKNAPAATELRLQAKPARFWLLRSRDADNLNSCESSLAIFDPSCSWRYPSRPPQPRSYGLHLNGFSLSESAWPSHLSFSLQLPLAATH